MKWLVGFASFLILVMVLLVLASFFSAVLFAVPVVLSIYLWYEGWWETEERVKLIAIVSTGIYALFFYPDMAKRPYELEIWLQYVGVSFFPTLLLFVTYMARNRSFEKTVPVLTYLVGFFEKLSEVRQQTDDES